MSEEVILRLRSLCPRAPCLPGCHECCGPVPFTEWEWSQVPEDQRSRADLIAKKVPVHHPKMGFHGKAIIAFYKKGFSPGASVESISSWMRLWEKGKADERCPFEGPGGCLIYPHRPIICRLFAAVADPRLTCKRGCASIPQLTTKTAMTIMCEWYDLLEGGGK